MDDEEGLLLAMIEMVYEKKYVISQSRSKVALGSLKKCIDICYNGKVSK